MFCAHLPLDIRLYSHVMPAVAFVMNIFLVYRRFNEALMLAIKISIYCVQYATCGHH